MLVVRAISESAPFYFLCTHGTCQQLRDFLEYNFLKFEKDKGKLLEWNNTLYFDSTETFEENVCISIIW
jgi:hypothetical protein